MTLWEILKANKTGIAPDMFTMLVASKMNGGRDRLHELSGTPPLSFTAKGKPLTAWSITGNTVQNGTPTPENPVEVLGCGDYDSDTGMYKIPVVTRGKNLLEPIGFSAQAVTNINDYRKKTNNFGTSLSTVYGGSVLVTQANQIDTTTSYMNGFFYIVVDFSKFTTGKNYILSFDYEIKEKHSASGSIAYVGNSTNFANISGDWSKDGRKSITFTVKEGFNPYIEIRLCGNSIFVSNIQIEEGTTATPYEPYHEPITTPIYLDSPLYKIGDYADRLSKTEEVRVVNELVLTGEENFSYDDTYTRFTLKIPNARATSNRSDETPCTHYISIHDGRSIYDVPDDSIYVTVGGGYVYINIKDITYTSLADFKSYLAAQYAAGTPVTLWYQLAEPTTETFTAPQIPTLNGTTVIDVDTAVKPESMTIKYRR